MERSPIYQTRSTRVLYYHRSHKVIAKYSVAVAVLAVLGALLGHGLPQAQPSLHPRSSASTVASRHQVVTDQLATTPAIVLGDEREHSSLGDRESSPAVQATSGPRAVAGTQSSMSAAATPGVGTQWQVFNTGGLGLCLRPDHDANGPPIKVLPEGTLVAAIDPEVVAADRGWRHVNVGGGVTGWVASQYLTQPR